MRFREFSEATNIENDPAVKFYRMLTNPFGSTNSPAAAPTDNTDSDAPSSRVGTKYAGISGKEPAFREPGFKDALNKTASNLGVNPNDLLQIMKRESGIDPHKVNPRGGATGLIQFVEKTAAGLGTSTQALGRMSAVEQLAYVEKYYKNNGVKPGASLDELYMYTFYPAAAGKPDNHVVLRKGSKSYANNAGMDTNKDGYITVADVKNFVHGRA